MTEMAAPQPFLICKSAWTATTAVIFQKPRTSLWSLCYIQCPDSCGIIATVTTNGCSTLPFVAQSRLFDGGGLCLLRYQGQDCLTQRLHRLLLGSLGVSIRSGAVADLSPVGFSGKPTGLWFAEYYYFPSADSGQGSGQRRTPPAGISDARQPIRGRYPACGAVPSCPIAQPVSALSGRLTSAGPSGATHLPSALHLSCPIKPAAKPLQVPCKSRSPARLRPVAQSPGWHLWRLQPIRGRYLALAFAGAPPPFLPSRCRPAAGPRSR